ncbi:MAG: type II toxin-antitoxin system VapC family toxin [Synergistaceae bacterium]|nr:type II toxin-antitoxin system VapC family toxin [Synergistaceae bacterium]
MLYFLDSNICITFLREGKKADLIRRKIPLHTRKNVQIPSVVSGELMHGAFKSNNAENMNKVRRFLSKFVIVPFDYEESEIYGQIRTDLERSGKLISFPDMLIAATALSYNATLVTNNTQEFSRIDTLNLSDWTI